MKKRIKMVLVGPTILALIAMFQSAPGAPAEVKSGQDIEQQSLGTILKELSTFEYGRGEEILYKLRDYVLSHKDYPESRDECEAKLISFLRGNATLAGKMAVCRELRLIGSEKSVSRLEKMLTVKETTDMARYALEKIPGLAADNALMSTLGKIQGEMKIGVISSLGLRKTSTAVPELGKLLQDSNPAVALAAATALGQIGGSEAAGILSEALAKTRGEAKTCVASSLLRCAEEYLSLKNPAGASAIYEKLLAAKLPLVIRQAAMKGRVIAAGDSRVKLVVDILSGKQSEMHPPVIALVKDIFDETEIASVCRLLEKLPETSQVQLIAVLASYPKEAVLSTLNMAAKSKQAPVRFEALKALEKVGDGSAVELLAERAAQARGEEQAVARESLWRVKGEDVDRAILFELESTTKEDVQDELIQAVGERRIVRGKNLLMNKARSASGVIRLRAIKNLKSISSPSDLPQLLGVLLVLEDDTEQAEMQNTAAAVALKIARPEARAGAVKRVLAETEDVKKRCSLLRVLGKIGDDSSLPILRDSLRGGNADAADAAVRALADWPTITARDDLLGIARTSTNLVHQVLALRAYVGLMAAEKYRSPQAVVQSLKDIFELAKRPEEKKLVLGMLPDFACADALQMAESLLNVDGVKEEAQAAVDKIKESLKKE
jgi:HEAT repeat protein